MTWTENWHNSELRFCDVPQEHQTDWLNETAGWLFKGRRWPMTPTDRMIQHCIHWWPRVHRLMVTHGWWPTLMEDPLTGYAVTWTYVGLNCCVLDVDRMVKESRYRVSQGACQAHYAAITGAAITRRKARYYGLWKSK